MPYRSIAPFSLAFLVLFTGCAMLTQPPGSVLGERPPFPPPGTRWVTRTTGEQDRTRTLTVLPDGVWEGRPVHRLAVEDENVILVDLETQNYIARLEGDTPVFVMTPHDGRFTWPLFVGKRWTSTFDADDVARGRRFRDVTSSWVVDAYEPVTVAAGRFDAFRLQSRPVRHSGVTTTLWYAPEIGLVVREIAVREGTPSMPGGRSVTELVERTLP